MKNWSLKKKVYASLAIVLSIVGVIGTIIYLNILALIEAQNWVTHTNKVIGQLKTLQTYMIDMETGQRGYLMSGDEGFLEPYHAATGKFEPLLLSLQKTVADNPAQVDRLSKLLTLKREWLAGPVKYEMDSRVEFDKGNIELKEFEQKLREGRGKAKMDAFRRVKAEAIAIEESLNVERIGRSESLANRTTYLVIFGIFGAILFGGLLLWGSLVSAIKDISALCERLSVAAWSLNHSSHTLSKSSRSIDSAAHDQASSLQQTAASITEISETIESTTVKSKDTAKQVDLTNNIAITGKNTVSELVLDQVTHTNTTTAREASSLSQNLTSQSQEIVDAIGNLAQIVGIAIKKNQEISSTDNSKYHPNNHETSIDEVAA